MNDCPIPNLDSLLLAPTLVIYALGFAALAISYFLPGKAGPKK